MGRSFLTHFVHTAKGSRRRYCRGCHACWHDDESVYSPPARCVFVALGLVPWVVLAICVIVVILTAPRIVPRQAADKEYSAGPEAEPFMAAGSDSQPGLGSTDGPATATGGYAGGMQGYGTGALLQRMRTGQSSGSRQTYNRFVYEAGTRSGAGLQPAVIVRGRKVPEQLAKEIESSDKQTLWNKYGSNFGSQEDAKAAYDEFMSQRSQSR